MNTQLRSLVDQLTKRWLEHNDADASTPIGEAMATLRTVRTWARTSLEMAMILNGTLRALLFFMGSVATRVRGDVESSEELERLAWESLAVYDAAAITPEERAAAHAAVLRAVQTIRRNDAPRVVDVEGDEASEIPLEKYASMLRASWGSSNALERLRAVALCRSAVQTLRETSAAAVVVDALSRLHAELELELERERRTANPSESGP